MGRLLLGLIKGAVIGGGVGYGAYHLGLAGGWGCIVYGVVGLLVGLVAGRPFWSHLGDPESTIWVGVLKGLVGYGVGVGIYALVHKVAGDPQVAAFGCSHRLTDWSFVFGGGVGAIYGAWVELDDPPRKKAKDEGGGATKA